MIWFKEGEEEKETDLGLSLAEGGAESGGIRRLKGKRIEKEKKNEVIYILHQEAF